MDKTAMNPLRCLVVDDEPLARQVLEQFIARTPSLIFAGSCQSAFEALERLRQTPIELLFCDIKMPELDGLSLLRLLDHRPKVILTTAFTEFGMEAFDIGVVDYLTKPIAFERFTKAVLRAHGSFETTSAEAVTPNNNFLFFKANRVFHRVMLADILYVEAYGNFVKIHTLTQVLVVADKISNIGEKLPQHDFMRVHKSYLVALSHIRTIDGNSIGIGQVQLPIGESYRDEVLKTVGVF